MVFMAAGNLKQVPGLIYVHGAERKCGRSRGPAPARRLGKEPPPARFRHFLLRLFPPSQNCGIITHMKNLRIEKKLIHFLRTNNIQNNSLYWYPLVRVKNFIPAAAYDISCNIE
jgi:hypothetical protein